MSQSVSCDTPHPPGQTAQEIFDSDRLLVAGTPATVASYLLSLSARFRRWGERPEGPHGEDPGQFTMHEEETMTKLWAVVLVVLSLLFVAPLIESGTSESSQIFQSVGNAEGGGGGA